MTEDNIFEIAERYGTPMYVFDIKELRERELQILKKYWEKTVNYAMQ